MRQEFEITVNDYVFGGDTLGRLPDGRAVFVPFAIPGEEVRIRLTEDKAKFARGEIVEILQSSPLRIRPKCPHFGSCGGCSYQHLNYQEQLKVKQHIVADQLRRLGGFTDFPVADVVPSPQEWHYRNSVQFHVSADGKMGFQKANSNSFVEVKECFLPTKGICDLWPVIDLGTEPGIDRLIVREGVDGDLIVGLSSDTGILPEFTVDFPVSAVFLGSESPLVLSGDDFILVKVKDRYFRVSINSFFQANIDQARAMVNHVLKIAGDLSGKTVLDGYCWVGLFSAFLAKGAKQVVAIETSESSCNDFSVNLDEFNNVELFIDQTENVLPFLNEMPDIVVVDPPRAGLEPRVISSLVEIKPEKIIYVSCDPATLARDLKKLVQGGYDLESVTPFDQFPQTQHVETVVLITRNI